MQTPSSDRLRPAEGAGIVLATALAYALVGWVALKLAIPPSYAAAIYPSAGIALAATLVYGRWGLVGTWLGSFAVNLFLTAERGQLAADGLALAVVVGTGAVLQAAAGRWLVRRWVEQPLTLTEPVDLVRFHGLGALLACTVSASVATVALSVAGVVEAGQRWDTWWAWWVGDTLGVLIGTPVVLTLIGRPLAAWRRRRKVVTLPLLAATSLLAAASTWVISAHEERVQTAFERDAWSLAVRLESHLRGPQLALLSMHSLFDTQERVTPPEMRKAAQAWLDDQPFIVAIGYSQRVARIDLPAFEARVQAEGPASDYRVFDRSESRVAAEDREVVAIRYIEPLEPNRRALGVNALSIPAAREALERALDSGRASSTAGFRLTQSTDDETGIVLYQPLYRSNREEVLDAAGRRTALTGLVFVTLRLDAMLADLIRIQPTYLNWCLVDPDPRAERRRLAGPAGCETATRAALHFVRQLTIGQRPFELHVDARADAVPGLANGGGWLFSVIGLLATSLLGALLLIVSGRHQRIEAAVTARTADLHSAGQALQASEERLRSIVDHVPIGVVYTDAQGLVREANPSLLAMLGLIRLAEPAPRLLDWTHPADRPEVAALMEALAAGQAAPARSRIRLLGAAGQVVSVQLGLTALYDAAGRPSRLVGVVEDIGEHIRLEASERAREQAEASNRAKSDFVSRMSHELRTPLNAMLGFGQLLARDRTPALAPHQQRWAAQIQDAGWHLLNMINDTLDLSMIESGALRLKPRILDPVALLEASLSLVAGAAERRGVSLRFPAPTRAVGLIRGDETRTKQILTNLLSNAVKYNVERGRVDVELLPQANGLLEIRVRDTGLGLSPEQLGQLFQPFNRLGREGAGIEGTGIGLVISRRLAELMGGSLEALSQVGQGSTFVLRLPLAEHDPAETEDAPATIPGGDYRRRHVHYVEDNETNVLLMRGMLAQRPQIELTVSELGLDALMAIRHRAPDLLLLDMHLPDIDGMDLLRHLKADPATSDLPVLVLSADATRERIESAIAEGAAGYLCKPLNLNELLSRLDELLAQIDTRWG